MRVERARGGAAVLIEHIGIAGFGTTPAGIRFVNAT